MAETNKKSSSPPLDFDQVIKGINKTLSEIDDSRAKKLGLAALRAERTAQTREKYILFNVGQVFLAILQNGVVEVGDLPSVTRLPNVPAWITGVTNVRSEIVSVIDLPSFMGWDTADGGSAKKIIIISQSEVKCAVQITQILGSHYKDEETKSVSETPLSNKNGTDFFKEGFIVDDKTFHVLDHEKLLTSQRFTKLMD